MDFIYKLPESLKAQLDEPVYICTEILDEILQKAVG